MMNVTNTSPPLERNAHAFAFSLWHHRNVPRIEPDPDAPIEVQIMGEGFLDVLHARNICENGIGIFVSHGFIDCKIDREIKLCITLPGHPPFLANARIVHETNCEKNFFGVVFTKIFVVDQRRIHSYMQDLIATQDEVTPA